MNIYINQQKNAKIPFEKFCKKNYVQEAVSHESAAHQLLF